MTPGKLLTAEQSVRLAIMDSMERNQLIAMIVDGLRAEAGIGGNNATYRACPFAFYSRPIGTLARTKK